MEIADFKNVVNLILKTNYYLMQIDIQQEIELNNENAVRVYPFLLFKNRNKEQYVEVDFQDINIFYGETREDLKRAENYAEFERFWCKF